MTRRTGRVAVKEEHYRMIKHGVWRAVPKEQVPANANVMASTWAMKKNSHGTYHTRMNMWMYDQINGRHYGSRSISSYVTNEATIHIILVLLIVFWMDCRNSKCPRGIFVRKN
jgi:hypothetical protein